jgi:peptide deformylase
MIRLIIQVPDPILHQVSATIGIFDAEMRKLSGDLLANGIRAYVEQHW